MRDLSLRINFREGPSSHTCWPTLALVCYCRRQFKSHAIPCASGLLPPTPVLLGQGGREGGREVASLSQEGRCSSGRQAGPLPPPGLKGASAAGCVPPHPSPVVVSGAPPGAPHPPTHPPPRLPPRPSGVRGGVARRGPSKGGEGPLRGLAQRGGRRGAPQQPSRPPCLRGGRKEGLRRRAPPLPRPPPGLGKRAWRRREPGPPGGGRRRSGGGRGGAWTYGAQLRPHGWLAGWLARAEEAEGGRGRKRPPGRERRAGRQAGRKAPQRRLGGEAPPSGSRGPQAGGRRGRSLCRRGGAAAAAAPWGPRGEGASEEGG